MAANVVANVDSSDKTVNKVRLNPIDMLSWKLLAVFHDPIHDFGLSIDRMCSIVKYINNVKDQIKQHENDPSHNVIYDSKFTGGIGKKRKYADKNDTSTIYIEERNIASIPDVTSPLQTDPSYGDDGKTTDLSNMYKLYKTLYDKYLEERNWFNNNGGLTSTGINAISEDNNRKHVYRLQTYTQFFTNITKLIDLFKFLIVIQVVNKHGMTNPPTLFSYNNVHKETVLSAMFDVMIAIGNGETDNELEKLKTDNEVEVREICYLLSVMEVIFHTISSRHCVLQLDLLNSSTFNNLVHIFFSCYFYNDTKFFNIFKIINLPRDEIKKYVEEQENNRRTFVENEENIDVDSEVSQGYNTEIEYEYECEVNIPYNKDYVMNAGKQRKRYDLLRPFILKGGAGAKFTKWKESLNSKGGEHQQLHELLEKWKVSKKKFDDAKKESQNSWVDNIHTEFSKIYDDIIKITIVKDNFPIFFNKFKKDIEFFKLKEQSMQLKTTNTRTNPKATLVTKISDYMNELSSEVDAFKAEMDNQDKRELKIQEKSNMVDAVDTTVTNQISKLMAKKGLEYAQATLQIISRVSGTEQSYTNVCLDYVVKVLSTPENTKLELPTTSLLPISYQILMNHIYFLGVAYLQHKNCLPDIDSKLINYWRNLLQDRSVLPNGVLPHGVSIMTQENLENLPDKHTSLRVINNGIPSTLKEKFSKYVVCPSSSVCDAMGSFGSCAGTKRKNEFISMNIRITNIDESDYYDVYSKIDRKLLEVVSNSFLLNFPHDEESMVIECRLGNINLDIKPEMLSANNVFKLTLGVIEEIMKEQPAPMPVADLWTSLYSSSNFKKIITPTCKKATGDINQELNSIVNNGGYSDSSQMRNILDINTKINVGLAGDRPSGVRMILLALYANRGELLSNFAVGYANVSDSLVVYQGNSPSSGKKGLTPKGGQITKTKFRRPKRTNTRKNKSHHYRIASKRRKYYNKTKKNKTKNSK